MRSCFGLVCKVMIGWDFMGRGNLEVFVMSFFIEFFIFYIFLMLSEIGKIYLKQLNLFSIKISNH